MSLQSKVILFFTVLLLLIAFQWIFFIRHEEKVLRDEMGDRGSVLVKTLALLSREPLMNYQITRLEMQIDSIKQEDDVLSARIVNSGFLVLADTRRDEEGWIYSGSISKKAEKEFTENTLIVREPVVILDKIQGMAEITFSLDAMNNKIRRSRILFIIIFFTEMILGAAFAVFLEIQVIRPLHKIASEVRLISADTLDRSLSLPDFSSVEILKVSHSLEDMRRKLRQSQEEIVSRTKLATMGKIAFNLAHEIRNPLEAISGAVDILSSEIGEKSSKHDYLQIIEEEIHNLNDYLTEFLEYTRTEPGKKEDAHPENLISDCILLLGPLLNKKNIHVENNIQNNSESCRVDVNQIKRVFLNILLNSIEAVDDGGEISLISNEDETSVEIITTDNGEGISEDNIERVFDPYFTTKKSGSGIGLALSKKIVEQHGGSINIMSREGYGTEVAVRLLK